MDKYLVRTPRKASSGPTRTPPKPRLIQATIESLPGVVVVEDIERLKTILQVKDQSKENLMQSLEELNMKMPPRDVLKSTKIGHIVKRLTKHSDVNVATIARSLVKKWTEHFQAKLDKPLIEVRCDTKTEELRRIARKHLRTALQCSASDPLVNLIEQEVFHQHQRLVSAPYRRTMRKLVFTLQHHPKVKENVMNKTLAVAELVTQYRKQANTS